MYTFRERLQAVGALSGRVDRHFARCAALAAAGVGGTMLASAETAEAGIVHSGVVNLNIPITTNGLYLNVVNGAINEPGNTGGGTVPGWDINPWSSSGIGMFNPSAPAGGVYVNASAGGSTALNLAPLTPISGASLFGSNTSSGGASAAQWVVNSDQNLVGFRFQNEANGNAIHFGWFRLSFLGAVNTAGRALVEYAYNDVAGEPILAGQIPEPGTLGMLALGAVGVLARRRRN